MLLTPLAGMPTAGVEPALLQVGQYGAVSWKYTTNQPAGMPAVTRAQAGSSVGHVVMPTIPCSQTPKRYPASNPSGVPIMIEAAAVG
jgi:hypothetical protein